MNMPATPTIIGPFAGPDGLLILRMLTGGDPVDIIMPPQAAAELGAALLSAAVTIPLIDPPQVGTVLTQLPPMPISGMTEPVLGGAGNAIFGLEVYNGPVLYFQSSFAFTRTLSDGLAAVATKEESTRGPIN